MVRTRERVVVDEVAVELGTKRLVLFGEEHKLVPVLVDRLRRSEIEIGRDCSEVHKALALHLQILGLIRILRIAIGERLGDDAEIVAEDFLPQPLVVREIVECVVHGGTNCGFCVHKDAPFVKVQ